MGNNWQLGIDNLRGKVENGVMTETGCPAGKVVITEIPEYDATCTWCGHGFTGLGWEEYAQIRETGTLPHTERKS